MRKIKNWHRFSFNMQLEDFYNYIDTMEGTIELHKKSLIKRFEEESKEMTDPEIKQEFYEHVFFDDYYNLDNTYTLILRKSLFISLYSFMESELQKIAKRLENKKLSNIKLADISHRGLQQYLFYIESVHNYNINISQDVRKIFINYNNLRNYFVHNDKSPIKQNQYNKIRQLPHINFKELPHDGWSNYYVEMIEQEFNKKYLDLISSFFDEIYRCMEDKDISIQ